MSHELDRHKGSGAMFSVGSTPWHREGHVLVEAPSLEEAMALTGTNFEVELRPLFVPSRNNEGSLEASGTQKVSDAVAVVRKDRNDVLATVGTRYAVLQNWEAFEVLRPLLDKGVATLETGGSLRGGRDVWMLVKFNIDDPVVREVFANEVVPFGVITNNHSGQYRASVMETPIRVVCANTLGMAQRRADAHKGTEIKVSHTEGAKVKIVEAAETMFGGIVERYRAIAENYRNLKERILTVEEFEQNVLDVVAPLPKELGSLETEHLTTRGYDLAYANAEKRRKAVTDKWENGKGHTGDHSAWEAYNGTVEVVDHDSELFVTRGSRVAAILGGRLKDRKTAVLNSVTSLVTANV